MVASACAVFSRIGLRPVHGGACGVPSGLLANPSAARTDLLTVSPTRPNPAAGPALPPLGKLEDSFHRYLRSRATDTRTYLAADKSRPPVQRSYIPRAYHCA